MANNVSIAKVQTEDRTLNQVQQNVILAVSQLQAKINASPTGAGVIVTHALITGSTTLVHSLGQTPKGWILVDSDAGVTVYRTAWTVNSLTLNSSGPCNASVLIF